MQRCLNAPVFGSAALLHGAGDCWGIGSVGLLLQVFVTGVVLIELMSASIGGDEQETGIPFKVVHLCRCVKAPGPPRGRRGRGLCWPRHWNSIQVLAALARLSEHSAALSPGEGQSLAL